jgi:hypothetical protein
MISHRLSLPFLVRFCLVGSAFVVTVVNIILHLSCPAVFGPESPIVRVVRHAPNRSLPLPKKERVYDQYNFEVESLSASSCTPLRENDVGFTLVTQLSFNRLVIMKEHCERWAHHPISLAVGTTEGLEAIYNILSKLGCNTELITVSLDRDFDVNASYPVNKLRNLAMSQVKTSHAVFIDADFVLSAGLFETLYLHRALLAADERNAIVIPAFELRKVCETTSYECLTTHLAMLPRDKEELMHLHKKSIESNGGRSAILQFNGLSNIHGHASTRYNDWVTQPAEQLLPIECVTSDRYEPYLVVRQCRNLPPFQEAFAGYGQNKITWVMQVRRTGYKFFQIGEAFLIHLPHEKSAASLQWSKSRRKAPDLLPVKQIADAFHEWMAVNVPDTSQIPHCS